MADVIFGKPGDGQLLGAFTLESLGLSRSAAPGTQTAPDGARVVTPQHSSMIASQANHHVVGSFGLRLGADANEGKTPAIGDGQARALLDDPNAESLTGKRDRAVLAVFLYHGLRCEELCKPRVKDLQLRGGVLSLRIHGKRSKVRFVPAHAAALERINDYLELAGHRDDTDGPLFRLVKNPITGDLEKSFTPGAVYTCIVKHHAASAGINMPGFCVHALRATATTNAFAHEADISKVQKWLRRLARLISLQSAT